MGDGQVFQYLGCLVIVVASVITNYSTSRSAVTLIFRKPLENQLSYHSISSTYFHSKQQTVTKTNTTLGLPQKCMIGVIKFENTLLERGKLLKSRLNTNAIDSDTPTIVQSDHVIKSEVWNQTRKLTNQSKIRKQQSHVIKDKCLTFCTSSLFVMFLISQVLLTFYWIRTVE